MDRGVTRSLLQEFLEGVASAMAGAEQELLRMSKDPEILDELIGVLGEGKSVESLVLERLKAHLDVKTVGDLVFEKLLGIA